jgi:hypothetical protein
MIPAEVKKKENIAAYIIHMYQTEDLILTYQFNLNDIHEYVIKHMSKNEAILKELLLWYADIIDQMQSEKIVSSKRRLLSTQDYVSKLTDIHKTLLESDDNYTSTFNKAKGNIDQNIKLSENMIENPVQICLNGIYGMLLLKLNGKKVSDNQQAMLANFGSVLEYLSNAYKKELPHSE